jgi:hypothetical protein
MEIIIEKVSVKICVGRDIRITPSRIDNGGINQANKKRTARTNSILLTRCSLLLLFNPSM